MKRRDLLKAALTIPLLPAVLPRLLAPAWAASVPSSPSSFSRVRPGDPVRPNAVQMAGTQPAAQGS